MPCNDLRQLPDHQIIDKTFISGHFFYHDIKNKCQPDAMLISILRDPIKRILSNYNYITNWAKHPLHEKTVRQSFSDHVYANRDFLRGLCCRHLAGVKRADLAIEIIQSRYALVGTTESLPAFITALSRIIGRNVVQERSNVSGGQGPKIDLSSELCQALLEITEEDRKLLAFVNALPNGLFEDHKRRRDRRSFGALSAFGNQISSSFVRSSTPQWVHMAITERPRIYLPTWRSSENLACCFHARQPDHSA